MTIILVFAVLILGVAAWIAYRLRPARIAQNVGPLADVIPWRSVIADGIVLCEGSRLLCAWQIEGADVDSLSFDKQADAVARAASGIVEAIGSEVVQINWDIIREEERGYPHGNLAAPDPTTDVMFESRLKRFLLAGRQYGNEYFMTLTWTPPNALIEALGELSLKRSGDFANKFERAVQSMQAAMTALTESLGQNNVEYPDPGKWRMRRLGVKRVETADGVIYVDELVQFLRRTFSHDNSEVSLPDTAIINGTFQQELSLEGVVADQDFDATFTPRVGENYFSVVQLETFKLGGTRPNDLYAVTNLPIPLRASIRAIVASPEEVNDRANRRFGMLRGNSDQRPGRRRNLPAERKAQSAENVDTEADRWFHWNVKVVVAGETVKSSRKAASRVAGLMRHCRFGARIEREGNPGALVASWPGDNRYDKSESLIDQTTLCDLAPVGSVYRGPKAHPNPSPVLEFNGPLIRGLSIGNTPVDVYDTVEDVAHTGCVGPIGSGKTTLSNGLVYLDVHERPDMDLLLFEEGYGAKTLVDACGGWSLDVDPTNELTGDSPYDMLEDPVWFELVKSWNLGNLSLTNIVVDEAVEDYVDKAQRLLLKSAKRSQSLLQAKVATFSTKVAEAMTPWTMRGVCGYMFDREVDTRTKERTRPRVVLYELSRVMRYRDPRLVAPLATLAFNRLFHSLEGSSRGIRVHLDEPQNMFENDYYARQLADFYDRVARKNRGGIRMFTQHPTQFLQSKLAPSILSGTKTWFLFPNTEAKGSMRDVYKESFQVTDEVCERVADTSRFQPKKHVGVLQNGHFTILNPTWQAEELAFIGATGKEQRLAIARLRQQFPKSWPGRWFEQCGLHDAARRWFEKAQSMGVDVHDDDRNAA